MTRLAWWYTAGFLGIFLNCHPPGLPDAEGRLRADVVLLQVGAGAAGAAPHLGLCVDYAAFADRHNDFKYLLLDTEDEVLLRAPSTPIAQTAAGEKPAGPTSRLVDMEF